MTLITEVESEKYLNMASRRRKIKENEELYPIPDDRLERPCGGDNGFDDLWRDGTNKSNRGINK